MTNETLQREMLSRMGEVYTRARGAMADDSRIEARMKFVQEEARLYYKYARIPSWPPRLLLNKIVRKLLVHVLMPQVEFNEAVRDVIFDLRQAQERHAALQSEMRTLLMDMEQQMQTVSHRLTNMANGTAHADEGMPAVSTAGDST